MAKDFLDNVDAKRVLDAISTATQDTHERKSRNDYYTEKERETFLSEFKTSGRKGLKLPRINLAFTPENHKYISVMSKMRGESITQFVNMLIDKNRELNSDLYDRALEIMDEMKS